MKRWRRQLRQTSPFVWLGFILAVLVFVRNAWVCEDAYINFRAVEQVFAGHGPIWNPHERVQVFTSPLWFGLLVLVRFLASDVYATVLGLSLALWLGCLVVMRRLIMCPQRFLLAVVVLLAANGFADFTSSGLESPLLFFLLALFVLFFIRTFQFAPAREDDEAAATLLALWITAGLVLCTRLDHVFLVAPAVVGATWHWRSNLQRRAYFKLVLAGLGPLFLWSLFSLVYYGFPFPNTAYAKLNTGIGHGALLAKGVKYYLASLGHDPLMLIGLVALIWWTRKRCGKRLLAAGVIGQMLYVAWVGGDFMLGRFLASAYFVAVIGLAGLVGRGQKAGKMVWVPLVMYALFFPHTPFNSPFHHERPGLDFGVVDERGFYNEQLSVWRYLERKRSGLPFPDLAWRADGERFRRGDWVVVVGANVGVFGYTAGTEKTIIDRLALTDPLLARLPVKGPWRVGHYPREIPEGYLAYVMGEPDAQLPNRELQDLANDMALITRSSALFSVMRWRAIWRQNAHLVREMFL